MHKQPFGWVEQPPSVNRLIGLAWLEARVPATLAALSNAVVHGDTPTPPELASVRPIQPLPQSTL